MPELQQRSRKQNLMADDACMDEVETPMRPRPYFRGRTLGSYISFYLSGEIGPPEEYMEWFEEIRMAGEKDIIVIHINSMGGDLMTAIQFMRAMRESRATILASIEGACASAATVIFLSANQFEVSDHSMFMVHNYSTMTGGKAGEIYDRVQHMHKWSEHFWTTVYGGFLTAEEIKSIIEGKDLWLSGPEVIKRLKRKVKAMKKEPVLLPDTPEETAEDVPEETTNEQ
jgi:ATP-dependent Clp protease protease subunit